MYKEVSIKKIADEVGIPVSTVSKALNGYSDVSEATRNKIVSKALQMGYSPNFLGRNLVRTTSRIIGLIVRDITSVYGEWFSAIEQVARENHLILLLCDSRRSKELENRNVRTMMDARVRGLIIAPVSSDATEINSIICGRIPTVYFGGNLIVDSENYVCTDNKSGVNDALKYLFSLGHRNIAFLCGAETGQATVTKINAYKQFMQNQGLKDVVMTHYELDEHLSNTNKEIIENLFEREDKITAVLCSKDSYAISFMKLVNDRGMKIPEDISVVGYDGSDISSLPLIRLTTVEQNSRKIAENMIRILLSKSEESSQLTYDHCYVKPSLVIRESCAKIEK